PFAVAPFADPGPHGETSVPNFATAGATVVGVPVLPGVTDADPLPWFPPHAAAAIPITTTTVARRARQTVGSFRDNMRPPTDSAFGKSRDSPQSKHISLLPQADAGLARSVLLEPRGVPRSPEQVSSDAELGSHDASMADARI